MVTEIPTSGHVKGHELLRVNELSQRVNMPIFANGGIQGMSDLEALLDNHAERLSGVVIGKIIHHKNFSLDTAQQLLNQDQQAV